MPDDVKQEILTREEIEKAVPIHDMLKEMAESNELDILLKPIQQIFSQEGLEKKLDLLLASNARIERNLLKIAEFLAPKKKK